MVSGPGLNCDTLQGERLRRNEDPSLTINVNGMWPSLSQALQRFFSSRAQPTPKGRPENLETEVVKALIAQLRQETQSQFLELSERIGLLSARIISEENRQQNRVHLTEVDRYPSDYNSDSGSDIPEVFMTKSPKETKKKKKFTERNLSNSENSKVRFNLNTSRPPNPEEYDMADDDEDNESTKTRGNLTQGNDLNSQPFRLKDYAHMTEEEIFRELSRRRAINRPRLPEYLTNEERMLGMRSLSALNRKWKEEQGKKIRDFDHRPIGYLTEEEAKLSRTLLKDLIFNRRRQVFIEGMKEQGRNFVSCNSCNKLYDQSQYHSCMRTGWGNPGTYRGLPARREMIVSRTGNNVQFRTQNIIDQDKLMKEAQRFDQYRAVNPMPSNTILERSVEKIMDRDPQRFPQQQLEILPDTNPTPGNPPYVPQSTITTSAPATHQESLNTNLTYIVPSSTSYVSSSPPSYQNFQMDSFQRYTP